MARSPPIAPVSVRTVPVGGPGEGAQGGVGRQAAACLVQAGLHRARAPADGQRDVALAQVGVVAQDDGDAQRQGQLLQRGQHGLGHLALFGSRLGVGARRGDVGQRLVTGAAVAVGDLAAQLGVARVDHDPVEPGPDARDGREGVAEAPGPQVGVLHGLLGVGPVAQDQARRAEGGDVPLLEPVCELLLHHPPL